MEPSTSSSPTPALETASTAVGLAELSAEEMWKQLHPPEYGWQRCGKDCSSFVGCSARFPADSEKASLISGWNPVLPYPLWRVVCRDGHTRDVVAEVASSCVRACGNAHMDRKEQEKLLKGAIRSSLVSCKRAGSVAMMREIKSQLSVHDTANRSRKSPMLAGRETNCADGRKRKSTNRSLKTLHCSGRCTGTSSSGDTYGAAARTPTLQKQRAAAHGAESDCVPLAQHHSVGLNSSRRLGAGLRATRPAARRPPPAARRPHALRRPECPPRAASPTVPPTVGDVCGEGETSGGGAPQERTPRTTQSSGKS